MPNQWGSYVGYGNIPFEPQYGSQAAQDYMGFWEPAWGAWLAPYLQQFGGSAFGDFWSRREGELRNQFEAENAQRLAQGGDLFSQMRPDEWFRQFDPMSYYLQRSPEARGEGRQQSPFTRWLNF